VKRHLNTLYVTTQGSYLSKDGANVVVSVDRVERARVPVHTIGGIVGFGQVALSPPLMGYCAEEGVSVSHLDERGRFWARVEGPRSGNVLLRRTQYRTSDDALACAGIVRSLVTGKALNQRAVVRRALRDHGDGMEPDAKAALAAAESRLTDIARRAQKPQGVDGLRGLEGEAGLVYFSVFDHLLRGDRSAFRFTQRSRRPPLDPVNTLLSFVYAVLAHDCRSALETVGLDPQVGFLHRDRPGRASLALDLMEEFRPAIADRLVLTLVNRRQVAGDGFRHMENGAVTMDDDTRRAVLTAWNERKREELRHPFLNETTTVGLLWLVQAQLLARHLRGDLDAYPPFLWK
jgi:CRISPR-associated protein Cas1